MRVAHTVKLSRKSTQQKLSESYAYFLHAKKDVFAHVAKRERRHLTCWIFWFCCIYSTPGTRHGENYGYQKEVTQKSFEAQSRQEAESYT